MNRQNKKNLLGLLFLLLIVSLTVTIMFSVSFSLSVALLSQLSCTAAHALYCIPLLFSSSCTDFLSLK